MNEWHVTFPGKKKTQKKKNTKKKTHTDLHRSTPILGKSKTETHPKTKS